MDSAANIAYSLLMAVGIIGGVLMMIAFHFMGKQLKNEPQDIKVVEPEQTFHHIDSWANLPKFGIEGHRYYVESTKTIYEWKDSHYNIIKREDGHVKQRRHG